MNSTTSSFAFSLRRAPAQLARGIILVYQKTLSPDHSWVRAYFPHGACKFHPTCSEYTRQAIDRYGLFRGTAMGAHRIARCHPWALGGLDPVK